ncbi:MAG: glycoside hydrolase/phage tail family protein [Pseudomonadota bacterium]
MGGGALGLSSVVIGRAIGATLGQAIDQRLLGSGSQAVESGKLDRMRIMGASEGGAIPRVFGRARVAGNVIWTSNYREMASTTQAGGKGAPKGPSVTNYSYSISIAVALCEGEIGRVGRIWADGKIIRKDDFNIQVYRGGEDQQPDPLMVSIEGSENVPAYRGVAYVVFEDLQLADFGNRVPQFTFEVVRATKPVEFNGATSLADVVRGVALLPGSGEYALASSAAYQPNASGQSIPANINTEGGQTDLVASLEALNGELPNCKASSLVVSWFGDDLRAGQCLCKPKVENAGYAGSPFSILGSNPIDAPGAMEWNVGGLRRADAEQVAQVDGRPIYGGTPTDASVVEAIDALKAAGQDVMFYPFLLMEILQGNGLPDPWSEDVDQAELPWRGRITTEKAPGVVGSTDQTAAARAEVSAFMGTAAPSDFVLDGREVIYTGPDEYSYRRFVLHYAHLCAAAGGVSGFCVGSEMRALTQIRDELGAFPAVEALRVLAGEVMAILPGAKIGYAADWSEYFGYHPQDGSGDVLFHLDPLWADAAIDFIGIDNYMPISDWRDGDSHADAAFETIYNIDYLSSNVAGGEGFEWYYASQADREAQTRTPITDGTYGESWVFRYKDLKGWWANPHHDRIGGVRSNTPTSWVPQSKPIWFTELGCAAIDKGPNQPNKFQDPKSSESALPYFSTGRRDDFVQFQFLRAFDAHFASVENNPVSAVYGEPMLDVSKTHVWAWDARPWPDFPNNRSTWSDGDNYLTGHWLTGRSGIQSLAGVVAELCEAAGQKNYDVSALNGIVRGYTLKDIETPRASLQNLMVTFAFDAVEVGGKLVFRNRDIAAEHALSEQDFVFADDSEPVIETTRAPQAETVGEMRVAYIAGESAFEAHVASAQFPDQSSLTSSQSELPLSLTAAEARGVAERWLAESRIARDTVRLAVPPSRGEIAAGDRIVVSSENGTFTSYRVDRIADSGARMLEASRVEKQVYVPSEASERLPDYRAFNVPIPITAQFMDLPLLAGDEVPHAPYIAVSADPWPGSAAVMSSTDDSDYQVNVLVDEPSIMGVSQTELAAAIPGLWSNGPQLRVKLQSGALSSVSRTRVLAGANAAAIGDGSNGNWEVFQFAKAELVAPDTYDLCDLLRGQAGTDGVMPALWPINSRIVILNGAPSQISQELAQRGLERHFRVGPSLRPYDDPSYRYYVETFSAIGLRPYAPAQLQLDREANGWAFSWIRRSRIDGDSWASFEVPLSEDVESYHLRVVKGGAVMREETVSSPNWIYSAADALSDSVSAPFEFQVAQISQSYGHGPFSRKLIDV